MWKPITYDKMSDQGPVWVRKDVIFQVQEKNIFILQNHSQMVLLGVWREDFTKKSPDHLFQVIRCCSDLMFPPKRDFILKKSLFLDGVHVQMINLFIKKFTHRLSALPQPYCSLSESPLSSLLSPCQPCSCPAAWFFSQPPTWYHPLQAFSQKG